MLRVFKKLFNRKPLWEYGTYNGDRHGRRNTKTGEVQFILWKAGEQGHTEDYWHNTDPFWWGTFEQDGAHSQ